MWIELLEQMAKMMPVVTKDPREWTSEERYWVITHRYEWIQCCLDYFEEEKKNRKLLEFVESKKNDTH